MQNAQQHEATACFAEQRGNHANYASHKTVQVIPPMMHVTNLTSMVTTLIVETRRRLDWLLILA